MPDVRPKGVDSTITRGRGQGFPPRYEELRRLGAGGAAEVWAVRDRVDGRELAVKVLPTDAGLPVVESLVREAVALSGLEGLGVPRVFALGTLRDGRRYMVRELVPGQSLDEILQHQDRGPWLQAITEVCDELTTVHRAGMLHGDVKPSNIIVGPTGRGTWVDLGLAAPWREGGATACGLTPKYAAPELLDGEPLTVRAEIYALGATLSEALARRGDELPGEVRLALALVAARATETNPSARWPSADELASALRRAAGLPPIAPRQRAPWPVRGLDATTSALLDRVRATGAGGAVVIEGPAGSGKSTLARRIAWTLGAEGHPVATIDCPESVALELEAHATSTEGGPGPADRGRSVLTIVADDIEKLGPEGRAAISRAMNDGAKLVAVGPHEVARALARGPVEGFPVPALREEDAATLVQQSMPSLPDSLRTRLLERLGRRPGPLKAAVRLLAGRPIVAEEDIDAALGKPTPRPAQGRVRAIELIERALATGRLGEAASAIEDLEALAPDADPMEAEQERTRVGLVRARIALGLGDTAQSVAELETIDSTALAGPSRRAWQGLRARAHLRAGEYAEAAGLAMAVVEGGADDALAADALSVRGVALALTGDDATAREVLTQAVRVAQAIHDPRVEAVALGSEAIAHQRAGRASDARAAYEASLSAAEQARDAETVAAMRLNLATLAQSDGDLAQTLAHLEAAVDMARRAGNRATLTQALLNLANLELYLGRWARARGSIDQLAAGRSDLPAAARAQLFGLEAELAALSGDVARGAHLFEQCACAWEGQGRIRDAAEARLESLLLRGRQPRVDARALSDELHAIRAATGDGGLGEHEPLAEIVQGAIAQAAVDADAAGLALDRAVDRAREAGLREWLWQALDARARLAAVQGNIGAARRDTETALALLEETAAKLPRDLREVFWNEPRRRGLRAAHSATAAISVFTGPRLAEDRLARVLEITRDLATEHDIERLLQRVTDHAVALLGAERGLVVLMGAHGHLEAHAARVRSGDDGPHARFSRSVADRVVESGEPVVAVRARDDARLAEAVSVQQLAIQSIACVPIRGAPPLGRTIGALYVETRQRPGVRFEQELPFLGAFADQAAIAIEYARLLTENRERSDALARANRELASARDELSRLLGKRTEQLAEARRDLKQARAELRGHFGFQGLVGTSVAMRRLYALIDRIKDADVAVLITGESGTGKEMVARAIHQAGARGAGKRPFLGVNCAAIPANLLESELFGSVRGAFTGADRDRHGVFQEADGGTLLLDEIGEMPGKMQAGLLRALEQRTVRPVGGSREEPVDVRVIAATNRDLAQMVAEGTFREDLFYRLHVVGLRVPALRDRVEDIPPLIDHFLSLFSARYRRERKTIERAALRALCAYPWPGNVRQLEHVLLSAWLMGETNEIRAADLELPAPILPSRGAPAAPEDALAVSSCPASRVPSPGGKAGKGSSTLATTGNAGPANEAEFKAAERNRILGALAACNWNRARAAQMIGVPRRTFYRRLKEFGIV